MAVDNQTTSVDRHPGDNPAASDGTLSAAEVRAALGLSVDQLGDLTARLELDVGPRVNYPRYTRRALYQLTLVTMLRELRAPLAEVAIKAGRDYVTAAADGTGWLIAAPSGGTWLVAAVASPPDMAALLHTLAVAYVLDLAQVGARVDRLLPPPASSA